MVDMINHPPHYENNKIILEPIDIIADMPFALGCAIKYLIRAPFKGNELEDCKKALFYLNRCYSIKGIEQELKKKMWVFMFMTGTHRTHDIIRGFAERVRNADRDELIPISITFARKSVEILISDLEGPAPEEDDEEDTED